MVISRSLLPNFNSMANFVNSVDLSGKEVDAHKVLNQYDEMIGYFLQTIPGPVKVENLKFVPITTEKQIKLETPENESFSHNSANDTEEIIVIKETVGKARTETYNLNGNVNNNESSVNFPSDYKSPLKKLTFTKQTSLYNQPDLSTYLKPASEGWRRECRVTDDRVSKVYYLSPPDNKGNFKRFRTIKSCVEICGPDSKLSRDNFTFVKRKLGLPSEFEIVINSKRIQNMPFIRMSMFENYYTQLDQRNTNGKKMVICKLCNVTILNENFSTHMRSFHLPDEICPQCGLQFPAIEIIIHIKTVHMITQHKDQFFSSTTSVDHRTEVFKPSFETNYLLIYYIFSALIQTII